MSGPMAAIYSLEPVVLSTALAAGLVAGVAENVAAGVGEGRRLKEQMQLKRRQEAQQRRDASRSGAALRRRQLQEQRQRLQRLLAAARAAGVAAGELAPLEAAAAADSGDANNSETEARRLQVDAAIAAIEARLQQMAVAPPAAALQTFAAGAVDAQAQLQAWLQSQRPVLADAALAARRRQSVAAELSRLRLAAGAAAPAQLEKLAIASLEAQSESRAAALVMELRRRVDAHNRLGAAAAAGEAGGDGGNGGADAAAAAQVLQQSLQDLGYAVEGIDDTLFVDGGVTHFQRSEWGDYFVRLRVDAARQAMNFNVVRSGEAAPCGDDKRAEERWCAEHRRLLQTLAARGVKVSVKRMLQAGAAPVQVVAAASLPQREDEGQRRRPAPARARR